jgi:hypothetical protein
LRGANLFQFGVIELVHAPVRFDPMEDDALAARIKFQPPLGLALDRFDGFQADGGMDEFLVLFGVELLAG